MPQFSSFPHNSLKNIPSSPRGGGGITLKKINPWTIVHKNTKLSFLLIGGRSSKGTIKGMFAKIAKRKAEEASSGNTKKAKVHLTN